MFIYTIQDKNNLRDIYIGQTKNFEARCYTHKRAAFHKSSKSSSDLYKWMRSVGEDNLLFSIECECDISNVRELERQTVKKYESLGFTIHNKQLTSGYVQIHERFEHRDEVYDMIVNKNMTDDEVANAFNISKSLIGKIMAERSFHKRSKLFYVQEEIKEKIVSGIPIRQLAREYGVAKSAIGNINCGKAFYDPLLDYPLNKNVRDDNLRNSWFKSKV